MKIEQRQVLVVAGFATIGALGVGLLLGLQDQPLFVDIAVAGLYALGCVPALVLLARQPSLRAASRSDSQDPSPQA